MHSRTFCFGCLYVTKAGNGCGAGKRYESSDDVIVMFVCLVFTRGDKGNMAHTWLVGGRV